MNPVDAMAMWPARLLEKFGVTDDNADLLRPGPETAEKMRRAAAALRAERLIAASGAMTAAEFREAIVAALEMLDGVK